MASAVEKETKDINDIFDSIVLSEERLANEGFQEGFKKGTVEGEVEGYHLGYHRGAEIGAELGYYKGVAETWLAIDRTGKQELPQKVKHLLHKILEFINQFPTSNTEDADIIYLLDNTRAKFKQACALLKIDGIFPELNNTSFWKEELWCKMQAEITAKLEEIIRYLRPLLPLANCHMVNFITEDLWEIHVPEGIRKEVTSMEAGTLNKVFLHHAKGIPVSELNGELMAKIPNFSGFLENARNMSLRGISAQDIVTSQLELKNKFDEWGYSKEDSLYLEEFMTHKKKHEVEIMSQIVAALADISKASHIVDIGSGKGYLSSILALHHKLSVLGVDSSQVNTHGAAQRTKKLERRWTGLCRRADILKQGSVPPRRGKHWKSRNTTTSEDNFDKVSEHTDSVLYKQVTTFVTHNTNLSALVKENFDCEYSKQLVLVGLHTCGDLTPTCCQIYVAEEECGSLCNVGCCYHLMEERYSHSPFWSDVDLSSSQGMDYGFPLSQFLNVKEFSLGRNARMLASQSLDRMGENHKVSSEPLFFRALLQVLLTEKCGDTDIPWGQVGRLKYRSFEDYVKKAIQKLHLNIDVNESEIECLYRKHSIDERNLHIFFLLRVTLAPVIEAVILLDRLLYLHEQGVQNSYLVQLFDPVISPRCYCIISLKNTPKLLEANNTMWRYPEMGTVLRNEHEILHQMCLLWTLSYCQNITLFCTSQNSVHER